MPQKYSRKMQSKLHHFLLPGFRGPGKSRGEDAVGDCLFVLEQAVFKRKKRNVVIFEIRLFPPFSPCCRLLFKDSFSPSDISVSEFISHKKHDICFLFNILFKVTVNFLNFRHFLLVASAGEHRANSSSCGCQKEAQGPVAGLWCLSLGV